MATSGSKSVTVGTGLSLKFSWSRSSYSIDNNTSTVSWQMDLITTSGNITSSASKTWSVVVNGTKYSGTNTIGIAKNSTKKLASGSTTISHSADGTKTFSYSFSQQFSITYAGASLGSKRGSGSGVLDTIPRVSTVSATNAYIGSNSTIKINRKSSSFKHKLQYKVAGQSSYTDIVSSTSNTSYSFKLDGDIIYPLVKSAKSIKITINCITYNGNTNIGSNTCEITATCKESLCAPTVSPTAVDTNSTTIALTGNSSKLIRYYSKATITSNAAAKNSATVSSKKITHNGVSSTASSATFTVTSDTFNFYVKDSRGFEINTAKKFTIVDYVKLTCALDVSIPTADGKAKLTVKGNYFNGNFGAVNNTLALQYRMKEDAGSYSSWSTLGTPTISGNKYSFALDLTSLDYTKKYTFQVRVTDKLATVNSKEVAVKTAPVFDWSADDFKFNVPVYTEEGYSITGAIKALTNSYALDTTGSAGATNWTLNEFTATLLGNNLRCTFDVTRSSATASGNVTNEAVFDCKIKHDGKIKAMYSSSVTSGGTGGVAIFASSQAKNENGYITLRINLAANATAITNCTGFFTFPVVIDTTKY